jgi:hypothetical protein
MARGRERNVQLFAAMFLSLGPDVLKLTGTAHDQGLLEARGLAAHRWSRLLDLEAQVQQGRAEPRRTAEEQAGAARR